MPRRIDAAGAQQFLARIVPSPFRNGRASQMYQGIRALVACGIELAAYRIPSNRLRCGGACLLRSCVRPREPHNSVALTLQRFDQCGAEETRRAGDQDAHGWSLRNLIPSYGCIFGRSTEFLHEQKCADLSRTSLSPLRTLCNVSDLGVKA